MFTPGHRRSLLAVTVLSLTLSACGAKAAGTTVTPQDRPATNTDMVTLALKIKHLEERVEMLEAKLRPGIVPTDETTDASEADAHAGAAEPTTTEPHAGAESTGAESTGAEHSGAGEHTATAPGEPPHWGYADAVHWGELAQEFATCGTGMEQSPIDLTRAKIADIPDAALAYTPAAATVTDNGHTVQVNLTGAGSATVDGHVYDLAQFHFHAPSEHTVDGVHSPVEAHFVHKDAEGNLAVIGVMIVEGAPNPLFDAIIEAIPAAGEEVPLGDPVDPRALMPDELMAYRYPGSLTTPPCTEGVTWSVLEQPITWSAEQVTALAAHFAEPNNRPVQPLNYRELQLDAVPG